MVAQALKRVIIRKIERMNTIQSERKYLIPFLKIFQRREAAGLMDLLSLFR